jgi:tRNA(adenine34) deaminase
VKPRDADLNAMVEALALAKECVEFGDVPVGAVVIDAQGAVIARGRNQREQLHDPTAHAEVQALRQAAATLGTWRLDECTLVVTLEPCTMCAGAALNSRISRIVFGADEPRTGAVGSIFDVVRDRRLLHTAEVLPGVMADESAQLLTDFFADKRNQDLM